VVRVTDNGIGIPPEDLSRVFDLFSQVRSHAARADGGLGIGLSLVRSLVEMHGGSVEAHSDGAGQGSTFTVRLPIDAR
jgi:signal transduction histidine kinase